MGFLKEQIFTAPNGLSLAGYLLVKDGVRRGVTTPLGLLEVGAGRTLDLLDGYVARKTGQSSKFGAILDAALDKLAVKGFARAVADEKLITETFEDALLTQNLANGMVTSATAVSKLTLELEPSLAGKRSMFLQGLALGAYALAETSRERSQTAATLIRAGGHVMAATGLFYYGPQATEGYTRQLFGR